MGKKKKMLYKFNSVTKDVSVRSKSNIENFEILDKNYLMVWQLPPSIVTKLEKRDFNYGNKLGKLVILNNGKMCLKIHEEIFYLDIDLQINAQHNICIVHKKKGFCSHIGQVRKRFIVTADTRFLSYKSI